MTSSLYTKVYNLFHQWLSTESEDESNFQEWLDNRYYSSNGKILIGNYSNYDYVVTDNTSLQNALSNVQQGEVIFISSGEYTISTEYVLPSCTIIGDSNRPVIRGSGGFNFSKQDDTGTGKISSLEIIPNVNSELRVKKGTNMSVEISNMYWHDGEKDYNWGAIELYTSDNTYALVDSCIFYNNHTTKYGHYCTCILCVDTTGAKNVTVQNCVFNGNRANRANNVNGGQNYRAGMNCTTQWNNMSTVTPTNCHWKCNQYISTYDTLYGFTEESC